jgi:hypothetical protein
METSIMKTGLNLLVALMIIVGTIFSLQGANILQGSVMTGESQWLVIGIGLVVGGVALLIYKNRK